MGAYIGVNGKAKKILKGYVGVPTRVPIYETTGEKVTITVDNIGEYFNVTNSTYYFAGSSGTWTSNNKAVNSSTAQTVLTLKSDGKVSFNYTCSSESNYDKLTITTTIGGTTTTRVNAVSGVTSGSLSYDMSAGDSITFKYAKDSSVNSNSDICTFSNLVHDTFQEVLVGYEEKELAKKIWRAYVGVGEKAKLAYSSRAEVKLNGYLTGLSSANHAWGSRGYVQDYVLFAGGGLYTNIQSDVTNIVDAIDKDLTRASAPNLSDVRQRINSAASLHDGTATIFIGGSKCSDQITTVEKYNNDLTKSSLTSLSKKRSHGSSTSSPTHSICAGGLIGWSTTGICTTSVEGFSNDTFTKTTLASLSVAKMNINAFCVGEYAVYVGGQSYEGKETYQVEAYSSDLTKISAGNLIIGSNTNDSNSCEFGEYTVVYATDETVSYDIDLTQTSFGRIIAKGGCTHRPIKNLALCTYGVKNEDETTDYLMSILEDGITYSGTMNLEWKSEYGYFPDSGIGIVDDSYLIFPLISNVSGYTFPTLVVEVK
jgi:hypothetical protein